MMFELSIRGCKNQELSISLMKSGKIYIYLNALSMSLGYSTHLMSQFHRDSSLLSSSINLSYYSLRTDRYSTFFEYMNALPFPYWSTNRCLNSR